MYRIFSNLIRNFPSTTFRSRVVGVGCTEATPETIIIRFFKKYCITNALDRSEDDILWEVDGEHKDDSDWVMDNDSIMSDDGESDE
jgi:hypothetical protein